MQYSVKDFKLEISREQITPRSGLVIFNEFLNSLALDKILTDFLPRPRSGNSYPSAVVVRCLLSLLYGGGTAISDLRELRSDTAFRRLLSLPKFPSDSATGDWLRRMGSRGAVEGIQRVNHWIAKLALGKAKEQSQTLIIDPTIIKSDKAEAKMSYLGSKGYRPVLAVFKEADLFVSYKFKEGNDNGGRLEFVRSVFSEFFGVTKIGRVLLDSEYYTSEVVNFLESTGVIWAIGAKLDSSIEAEIAHIEENCWSRFVDKDGIVRDCEVAETIHVMSKSRQAFRLIVKRWLREKPESLFGDIYHYHAIATNADDLTIHEVVSLYNGRATIENCLKELKGGFGLSYMPSGDFGANAVYFGIGVLAYNLFSLMKALVFPVSFRHKTIKSIRWLFVETAGKLVCHSRRYFLRLSVSEAKFGIFVESRERLRCLRFA